MSENGWIITGLVALIITLFGLVMRNFEQRLSDMEKHQEVHDVWASGKAEELSAVKQAQISGLQHLFQRLDRMDGVNDKVATQLERIRDILVARRELNGS